LRQEVHRLLAPGGTFLLISLGTPEVRLAVLAQPGLDWDVQLLLLPKPGMLVAAAVAGCCWGWLAILACLLHQAA
jgi:hypothetical protein